MQEKSKTKLKHKCENRNRNHIKETGARNNIWNKGAGVIAMTRDRWQVTDRPAPVPVSASKSKKYYSIFIGNDKGSSAASTKLNSNITQKRN